MHFRLALQNCVWYNVFVKISDTLLEDFMPRISFEEIAKQNVARLLDYAQNKLYLSDLNAIYAQNQLLDALGLSEPCAEAKLGSYDIYEVMSALSDFAVCNKIVDEN